MISPSKRNFEELNDLDEAMKPKRDYEHGVLLVDSVKESNYI